MLTAEQYLQNPCGACSTAFWKVIEYPPPEGISIIHQRNLPSETDAEHATAYFRLIHRLESPPTASLDAQYTFREVDTVEECGAVADMLNHCYDGMRIGTEAVASWTKRRVFDGGLWLWVVDKASRERLALGIADFDSDIGEGSLEWIQTLPEDRRQGFGYALVCEMLNRLKEKADFATVSGEADNVTNPEALYRRCGFNGSDVWYVGRLEV